MSAGCAPHAVSSSRVAEFWPIADDRVGSHVGLCLCCEGPSRMIRLDWMFGDYVGLPLCEACREGAETMAEIGLVLGGLRP